MEVVALVNRITAVLDRAVKPLYQGAALTTAEVQLLVPLRHAEPPLTAARLAAHLGMSRAGVSKTLAKLEARGLVAHTANPADRRTALIGLTPGGEDVIDDLFPRELAAHAHLLAGLGSERAAALSTLTRLAEAMEARLGGVPAP
ncbi:MarR family winged helix-turn-helix transcriptional regulator [Pseudonocardia sp. MH-G8]|uniref:MarR family winged helix-turn-helix transcriptional regulator n=1 Tax=Pseudonocardia sp. MH-G8 TaxID=1854588 RepID=UPI000B9FC388|nr:MarR family winged helix-turn-helix transcriptional regulator [Pseudonocardia sp. MH-G8]OZM76005.1 MarR family transcriptional regulator [Pseudonocardia sp. MH-G8]